MERRTIESDILRYLREELGVAPDLARDDPLFSSGTIDSFDLVQILSFLRERYALDVSPLDVSLENFDSVARIGELVAARTVT